MKLVYHKKPSIFKILRVFVVAGVGFEPTTFGLWARRATRLLHPASWIISIIIYKSGLKVRWFLFFSQLYFVIQITYFKLSETFRHQESLKYCEREKYLPSISYLYKPPWFISRSLFYFLLKDNLIGTPSKLKLSLNWFSTKRL